MLPGERYHIYNHANGRENLFHEDRNYLFFLKLAAKHILPVSKIFAYCLMQNHFHFLVQIKEENELITLFETQIKSRLFNSPNGSGFFNQQEFILKKANKAFSNLFNSYTQSFNKVYMRRGSLFMQNMKKKEINDDQSFCKVVHYIHANPVHHKFVSKIDLWPHSSYRIFLSNMPTNLEREYVLKLFGGLERFIKYHEQPIDPKYGFFD